MGRAGASTCIGRVVAAEAAVPVDPGERVIPAITLPGAVLQRGEALARVYLAAGARPLGQRGRRRVGAEAAVVVELADVIKRKRSRE